MPGIVKIEKWGKEFASARYNSLIERNSIISYFTLLYDEIGKSYTLTCIPDDCTEAETVTQLSKAGCLYRYMRATNLHSTRYRADYTVAS